jgi:hypothetical protein
VHERSKETGTRKASRPKTYDLHVIPEIVVQAIKRDPERTLGRRKTEGSSVQE